MRVSSVGEVGLVTRRLLASHVPESIPDVLHSPFERAGVSAAYVDRQLRLVAANADFAQQFGIDAKKAVGRSFVDDLLHPSLHHTITRQCTGLSDGKRGGFTARIVGAHADGSTFAGELTGVAVRDEHGRNDGVLLLLKAQQDHCLVPGAADRVILTEVDAQILEGIAAGVSTVKLGSMLYLSRGGVEYHLSILLRKLKVNNRPALISKAFSLGLLNVGVWPPKVLPECIG